MNIEYHNTFIKNYKKRFRSNLKFNRQYKYRLKMFIDKARHPLLQDHSLKGEKLSLRAFSVTGDVRVVYKQIGKKIAFLDIGTHNQVY